MHKFSTLFILLFFCLLSCSDGEETPEPPPPPPATEAVITRFVVKDGDNAYDGDIDNENKTIYISVDPEANIRSMLVEVTYTEGATLNPASGYNYNFTEPVVFRLSADGKQINYTVTVSSHPQILTFELPDYQIQGTIDPAGFIEIQLPYGIDPSKLIPQIQVASGSTLEPASGVEVDLSKEFTYTVTNKLGVSKEYTVKATVLPQEKMVRGVWVPDPTHTSVMNSYKNLREFIDLMDELHINTLFLATWVREQTLYKSEVLKQHTNYQTVEEGWLFRGASYDGPTGDPVKDLLTLAHEKNIKVFFWFEYGFMRSGGSNPSASHPILSVHPEWDGVNSLGQPSNYNGTDYYLNSYDEDVQEFMLQLMEESIELYPEVDGIQGDDRLPAAPRNSGYNEKTLRQYQQETGKTNVPAYQDAAWVQWRLDNLNAFGKRMYERLKAKKSGLIVGSSPNPYPWCVENLMQDWPTWIKGGYVDLLSVQCYRETASSYYTTLQQAHGYVTANTDKNIFNPGIYLRSTADWEEHFIQQMRYNRELNTNGESFFYNESLKREVNKRVLQKYYIGKALFPFE